MSQVTMPEFKRGMEVVYNILKDGKSHTRAALKTQLAKHGIKKSIFGRCYRLGRMLRAEGIGDVVITRNPDDNMKSSAQLILGAKAKKSIAEKKERYAGLAGTHSGKSKKAAKKSAKSKTKTSKPKSASKKTSAPIAAKKTQAKSKKTAPKKTSNVLVTAEGSEASSDNEVLES